MGGVPGAAGGVEVAVAGRGEPEGDGTPGVGAGGFRQGPKPGTIPEAPYWAIPGVFRKSAGGVEPGGGGGTGRRTAAAGAPETRGRGPTWPSSRAGIADGGSARGVVGAEVSAPGPGDGEGATEAV